MKTLIVALALFLAVTSATFGQEAAATRGEPRPPEERAEAQTSRLTKALSLTAEQQTQVKAILLARDQKAASLRGTKPAVKGEKMRQAKAIKDETDAEMKKVLSEAQFQQYTQRQDENMEKMREKRKQRRGGR